MRNAAIIIAISALGCAQPRDEDVGTVGMQIGEFCMGNWQCDDHDPCTTDYCNRGACDVKPKADRAACGHSKYCIQGECVSNLTCNQIGDNRACNTDVECNDGNECTDDICIDDLGQCGHYLLNNAATCGNGASRCDGYGCCCDGYFAWTGVQYECVVACPVGTRPGANNMCL